MHNHLLFNHYPYHNHNHKHLVKLIYLKLSLNGILSLDYSMWTVGTCCHKKSISRY